MRGRGGPGDEHELFDERWEWEQELGRDGWIGLGWPAEYGGRGATLVEQVIFFEEYARAGGPGRVGIVGEGLLGPTIVHFGRDDAEARGSCPASCAAPRSGARATPSRTRAPTSPTCRPAPSATATSG